MLFLIVIVLGQFAIFVQSDTGYDDGVYAVVDMVHALLGAVNVLKSPYLSEIRCGEALYRIHSLEDRLQIEPGVF